MLEGGQSTGLAQAIDAERAWTVQGDAWYNDENQQVCLTSSCDTGCVLMDNRDFLSESIES